MGLGRHPIHDRHLGGDADPERNVQRSEQSIEVARPPPEATAIASEGEAREEDDVDRIHPPGGAIGRLLEAQAMTLERPAEAVHAQRAVVGRPGHEQDPVGGRRAGGHLAGHGQVGEDDGILGEPRVEVPTHQR